MDENHHENANAKYLFMTIWDATAPVGAVNLIPNQKVRIDHSNRYYLSIRPGQTKSTPGVLMPKVVLTCGRTYSICLDGYTNSVNKVFLWAWVTGATTSVEREPIIDKRYIFIRKGNSLGSGPAATKFYVTFCYLAGTDCCKDDCKCGSQSKARFGLFFDDPDPNNDELVLRRFELQEYPIPSPAPPPPERANGSGELDHESK